MTSKTTSQQRRRRKDAKNGTETVQNAPKTIQNVLKIARKRSETCTFSDGPQLLQIVHARYALCLGLGFGKSRKEHASQNGDDRNDHQQFDEGEGSRFLSDV